MGLPRGKPDGAFSGQVPCISIRLLSLQSYFPNPARVFKQKTDFEIPDSKQPSHILLKMATEPKKDANSVEVDFDNVQAAVWVY